MDAKQLPALLRRTEVEARTGLTRSTLYSLVSQGNFPKPIELHGRSRAWIEAEVTEWIANRIRAARKVQG